MGLDNVELVMEVEKAFSIRIPDREAEQIITVGHFHNSVWSHLAGRQIEKCHSQSLFYKLRASFMEQFDIAKGDFELDTNPNHIFPNENRREAYLEFAGLNNLELPSLVLSKPWSGILNLFGIISILGFLILSCMLKWFFDYSNWVYLLPVVGIFLTLTLSRLMNSKRVLIKSGNLKDFTREILAKNYTCILNGYGTNRREMEMVINQIIADKSGLELEEISAEKKIGDDLGIS